MWKFEAQVCFGGLDPAVAAAELCAEGLGQDPPIRVPMTRLRQVDSADCYVFTAGVPANRPAEDYTVRIVPAHPHARVPLEECRILWQK